MNTNNAATQADHIHYRVYGQRLCSNVPLPQMRPEPFEESDITFRFVPGSEQAEYDAKEVISESRHETNVGGDLIVLTFADRSILRFEGRCDFVVKKRGHQVECYSIRNLGLDWIRSIFYGMVMSYCLHLLGKPNLHASAFATRKGSLGFMAAPGSGKSTLVATFGARGFPVVTDDVLAIDWADDEFLVHSGFPYISLSEESANGIFGSAEIRPEGYLNGDKYRLEIDGKWAEPETDTTTLKHLIVLSRLPANAEITIERITGIESSRIVVENTLCLEFLQNAELSRHLDFATRIVSSIPVWRLSYPTGFDRVTEVQDAVLAAVD